MSIESYILGLQKNPSPGKIGKIVLGGLELLAGVYEKGVVKKYEKAGRNARRMPIPVISVGNITAGGTGKTPCILKLAEMLHKKGHHPAILSRGYKSGLEKVGGVVSDGRSLRVSQKLAGDEPYMMALKIPDVPVLVGRNRITSAEKAIKLGADILLLDDGFQYWDMKRDLDIVLIDCTNPFGYGYSLPRGLLREPMEALRRAHTFILTKSEQADVSVKADIKKNLFRLAPQALILESFHSPSLLVPFNKWKKGIKEDCLSCQKGRRTFILSGIGNPEAFKETTLEAGLNPVGSMFFPDHHVYTSADMESAEMAAAYSGADLITVTEKDAVKMLNLSKAEDSKIPLYVLEIEMKFAENGEAQLQEQWEVFL